MTNQEFLSEQIKKLPPEEVYDLIYGIVINLGRRYNTSRGGIAEWLTQEMVPKCVNCTGGYCEDECLRTAEQHGRWIDLQCDQCGQVDMSKPNYCPSCGAKMDEVEE